MTRRMGLLGCIGQRKADILIQINEQLKNEQRQLYKENIKIQMIKRSSNQ